MEQMRMITNTKLEKKLVKGRMCLDVHMLEELSDYASNQNVTHRDCILFCAQSCLESKHRFGHFILFCREHTYKKPTKHVNVPRHLTTIKRETIN